MLQRCPTLPLTIVVFLCASFAFGCGARPATRPSVVPTDEVISAEAIDGPIAVRVLWVSYAGAEGRGTVSTRTRAQAAERARMLSSTARTEAEDFWSLVRSYSDRPAMADPGPVGKTVVRGDGVLPKLVEDAAFRLLPGQVSEPIDTPAGFAVVMRTEDPSDRPTMVAAKHILVSYRGAQHAGPKITRSKEEALERATELRAKVLVEGADWDAIANENTDEPGAGSGGDLGLFGPGQMVPTFERAAFALGVGEVSQPIESPFGFHIIRRYK